MSFDHNNNGEYDDISKGDCDEVVSQQPEQPALIRKTMPINQEQWRRLKIYQLDSKKKMADISYEMFELYLEKINAPEV